MNKPLTARQLNILDFTLIIGLAIVPLFSTFPYRVNIFLSWEGAYRLYLGHVPYKDFGLPMGFGYWIIPALFFKIFGPHLMSLIKAQVFINIIAGFGFRSILNSLQVNGGIKTISLLLFCVSYSFFNFWPWYNHSVIVFEIVAIAFLLKFIFTDSKIRYLNMAASALFLFWSIFTKQDGGGLALLVCGAIVLYHAILEKAWKDLVLYALSYLMIAAAVIVPFLPHGFGYWFNYGQEPHYSRVDLLDLLNALMAGSMWEKFYIAIIVVIMIGRWRTFRETFEDKYNTVFLLLTLGILAQALIFQVTSYTPPDNNIFFHSFAIAFILSQFTQAISFQKLSVFACLCSLIMIWWSGVYWKYIERTLARVYRTEADTSAKISRSTYVVQTDTTNIKMDQWRFSNLKPFEKVYMPGPTVDGINRLMNMPEIRKENPEVLNMTELTPLASAIPYELRKGQPLWYHKGVAMFQDEVDFFCKKIVNKEYDVVLFEVIPYLNNFYPEEVRACLQEHYQMNDRFLAPRRPTDSHIEVYTRK